MTEAINQSGQPGQSGSKRQADPLIGQTLMGCYAILDILGTGGMAIVYKAKQLHTDRIVAIKTLKSKDKTVMKRFFREMQTLSKLKHQNIIEAIDCLETQEGTFFAMEYCNGISLQEMVKSLGKVQKEEDIGKIIIQVCNALEHAHKQGIIHRDLKPGNIMLLENHGDIFVKVLDFGIAKLQDDLQKLTTQGEALGSPLYMSPEQCMGLNITPASDVYSLGVVSYELITGRPPYQFPSVYKLMEAHCTPTIHPEPISAHRPDLPGVAQLDQIINRALQTELSKRFESVADLKKAINFWMQSIRAGQGERPLPKDLTMTAEKPQQIKKELSSSMVELIAQRQKRLQESTQIMQQTSRRHGQPLPSEQRVVSVKGLILGISALFLTVLIIGFICINFDQVKSLWISASAQVTNVLLPKREDGIQVEERAPVQTDEQDTTIKSQTVQEVPVQTDTASKPGGTGAKNAQQQDNTRRLTPSRLY